MPTRELQASRFRRCLMTAANLTLCGGQNSSAEIKGGAMRNWRLALMAGALSMAASSISASAQSVPNQYGGGFSLRLPLGDSGGRPTVRPWVRGGNAAGSISSNTGSTSSANVAGSAPVSPGTAAGAGGGATFSSIKKP